MLRRDFEAYKRLLVHAALDLSLSGREFNSSVHEDEVELQCMLNAHTRQEAVDQVFCETVKNWLAGSTFESISQQIYPYAQARGIGAEFGNKTAWQNHLTTTRDDARRIYESAKIISSLPRRLFGLAQEILYTSETAHYCAQKWSKNSIAEGCFIVVDITRTGDINEECLVDLRSRVPGAIQYLVDYVRQHPEYTLGTPNTSMVIYAILEPGVIDGLCRKVGIEPRLGGSLLRGRVCNASTEPFIKAELDALRKKKSVLRIRPAKSKKNQATSSTYTPPPVDEHWNILFNNEYYILASLDAGWVWNLDTEEDEDDD